MLGSFTYKRLGSRLEQTLKEFGLKNVEYKIMKLAMPTSSTVLASNKKISEDKFAS